jgi:hypothetical protein
MVIIHHDTDPNYVTSYTVSLYLQGRYLYSLEEKALTDNCY